MFVSDKTNGLKVEEETNGIIINQDFEEEIIDVE